jgi:hypothetical protein
MSRVVRVYLPATMDDLTALVSGVSLTPRRLAHAVTARLQAEDPEGNIDEWEFTAFLDAAHSSLALLSGAGVTPRRVVLSADVEAAQVREPEGEPGAESTTAVEVVGAVPASAVASVHVDGPEFCPVVRSVLDGAPPDALDEVALEWYSPNEVAALLS